MSRHVSQFTGHDTSTHDNALCTRSKGGRGRGRERATFFYFLLIKVRSPTEIPIREKMNGGGEKKTTHCRILFLVSCKQIIPLLPYDISLIPLTDLLRTTKEGG